MVALNDGSDAVGVEQRNIAIQYAGRVSAYDQVGIDVNTQVTD